MIDYDHQQGGSPCNSTLSNAEGRSEMHWTFGSQDEAVTETRPLTDAMFALLWDGISTSVGATGVFWRCLVTDPTRLIDPDLYHVITTTQAQDGRMQHRTFMVPAGEMDPTFLAWLGMLAVPVETPGARGMGVRRMSSGSADAKLLEVTI